MKNYESKTKDVDTIKNKNKCLGRIIYCGIRNVKTKCRIFKVYENHFELVSNTETGKCIDKYIDNNEKNENENENEGWSLTKENLEKYATEKLLPSDNIYNVSMYSHFPENFFDMVMTMKMKTKMLHDRFEQLELEQEPEPEPYVNHFISKNWAGHILNCDLKKSAHYTNYYERKNGKQGFFEDICLVCNSATICIITNQNNLILNSDFNKSNDDKNIYKNNNLNMDDSQQVSDYIFHFCRTNAGFNLFNNSSIFTITGKYKWKTTILRAYCKLIEKYKINLSGGSSIVHMMLPFDGIDICVDNASRFMVQPITFFADIDTNHDLNDTDTDNNNKEIWYNNDEFNVLTTYNFVNTEKKAMYYDQHRYAIPRINEIFIRLAECDIENTVNIVDYAVKHFRLLEGGSIIFFKYIF